MAARLAGRDRRSRREIPFRYFIDNRLFRLLCDPGKPAVFEGFRAALAERRLLVDGSLPEMEMTPLGVLDALGLEPPPFRSFRLPAESLSWTAVEMVGELMRMAKGKFAKLPELQPENLRGRSDELRRKANPAAHELFDRFLTRFLSNEQCSEAILKDLALDAAFRFPLPEEMREDVLHFYKGALLSNQDFLSGLTKTRVLKVCWDRSYERLLKKNPQARKEIQEIDQEVKPRTFEDYLILEVVHFAVLGYSAERVHPVIAFMLDSEETLKDRCTLHKTALRAFLDEVPEDELATVFRAELQAWKPGWLVPCRDDGTFGEPVSTGELPIFS